MPEQMKTSRLVSRESRFVGEEELIWEEMNSRISSFIS
jgi:hypothetical protein